MPMMPSVYAIAVAISASATTGTTHDVVDPAMAASLAVKVSGMMPTTPRNVTAAAPTTRPPAASVIGLHALTVGGAVATLSDITK